MVTRRFAAILAFVLLSLGLAACGGGANEGTPTLPEDPQGMAEAAGFHGIKSGELEIALEIDRYKSGAPEEVNMRILGSFMGAGEEHLPQMDVAIESHGPLGGREINFNGGVSLLENQATFSYGPSGELKTYRADDATFERLKLEIEEAQQSAGDANVGACLEAAGNLDVASMLGPVSSEGKAEAIDGTKVKVVGADLNLHAVFEELLKLTEDPACQAQMEAVGVPPSPQLEEIGRQLEGSVVASRVTLDLDKQGIIRYLKVLTNVELPHSEELEIELVIRLNSVNEVTGLPLPSGSGSLPALLKRFGVDMQTLEEADIDEVFLAFLEANATSLFGRGNP